MDVKHVLEPVRTFGHSHVDPIRAVIGHAAVPRRAKLQDVLVESVRRGAVLDGDAEVDHAF